MLRWWSVAWYSKGDKEGFCLVKKCCSKQGGKEVGNDDVKVMVSDIKKRKKINAKMDKAEQVATGVEFDNHQPQEIPEVIPFIESKEWIEIKNELFKMMEAYTERMNQQHEQKALLAAQREQELLEQEQAAQREQELLAQKQAAQKKEEPPTFVNLLEKCVAQKFVKSKSKN
ncbi:hypothetical protein Tco_1036899 [Tanacetum coccineum]